VYVDDTQVVISAVLCGVIWTAGYLIYQTIKISSDIEHLAAKLDRIIDAPAGIPPPLW
jgi:hypothetical protein